MSYAGCVIGRKAQRHYNALSERNAMEVLDPKYLKIEADNRDLRERLLVLEARHEELSRKANSYNNQTTWQFISFAITMVITVLGAVYYQTSVIDKRIDLIEKNMNVRIDQVEKRLEAAEKSINGRFEDLRQVVLADRKAAQK
jgi:prefoldin subunit 5